MLVYCHAGCQFAEIVEAAGLTTRDLAPERVQLQPQVITHEIRDIHGTVVALHRRTYLLVYSFYRFR